MLIDSPVRTTSAPPAPAFAPPAVSPWARVRAVPPDPRAARAAATAEVSRASDAAAAPVPAPRDCATELREPTSTTEGGRPPAPRAQDTWLSLPMRRSHATDSTATRL